MKTENIIFLVWAVIFILILCQLFILALKRRYLNTYIEVLDGDVLSYECQNTGVVIDTKKTQYVFSIHIRTALSNTTTSGK
ncbi:hypothetical protein [Escherichia coli]|uniref:hypothetical protein n=1 Tax=Escherichia coli TaxID=562 RepID=UPI003EB779F5